MLDLSIIGNKKQLNTIRTLIKIKKRFHLSLKKNFFCRKNPTYIDTNKKTLETIGAEKSKNAPKIKDMNPNTSSLTILKLSFRFIKLFI